MLCSHGYASGDDNVLGFEKLSTLLLRLEVLVLSGVLGGVVQTLMDRLSSVPRAQMPAKISCAY